MKNTVHVRFVIMLFAAFLFSTTGCLKDKGFTNHEYGINSPEGTPVGVGFLQGVKFLNAVGLNLGSESQDIISPLTISLLSTNAATADVHVQIAADASIVDEYNAANGTDLQLIDPALYSILSTNITIPAGQKTATVTLTVPSTLDFDASLKYAIGVRIVSADPGYIVASNEDEILLVVTIKNKYDGVWELHGQFYHPTSAPGYPTFTTEIELQTTGPNSVIMYSPEFDDFLHPWSATTGGSLTAFGAQSPEYTIDPTTNLVTVQNVFPGAVTFYDMGIGYDNAGYISRYEETSPTEKKMFVNFGYNLGAGGAFNPAASREWIDTLIYIGPR